MKAIKLFLERGVFSVLLFSRHGRSQRPGVLAPELVVLAGTNTRRSLGPLLSRHTGRHHPPYFTFLPSIYAIVVSILMFKLGEDPRL